MNQINPRKLKMSKWTAVQPRQKEKHFLITEVSFDEDGRVIDCRLEAVMSRRELSIDWRELKDEAHWRPGWR